MNEDLISVIMPAYNAEKFITESIKSVLAQTYTNWELLMVDDGSVDTTKDIIKMFCAKDGRIKYFWQDNAGPGKARNLAIANANGFYAAFLDADDIWFPRKLELQVKQLKEKKADLVFSDAYSFYERDEKKMILMNAGQGYFNDETGLKKFLEKNQIPILTVLTKTSVLQAVNGFTESPLIPQAEDYHLWLRLLMNGYVFFGSDLILAMYRQHDTSFSNADKLSVPGVIEALRDLKCTYKSYAGIINNYLKKWFVKYHYSKTKWDNNQYKSLIKKNCNYVDKPKYKFIFQIVYSICGFNITRRLINKIINNSLMF